MPLFKGQGCKSTPAKAIDYVTDERKAEFVSSQNLDDSRNYAEQFQETARRFGKGTEFDERKYYSFKLSCDRADNVSAEAHHEYAEALAKQLFPNHECVIATHADTDTVHSHIIVNAVDFENGKKLDIRNQEYGQMKDRANEIGVERGFTPLNFRHPAKDRIPSRERWVTLHGGTSWKEELREVITEAKLETTNMADFEKHLNDYGVTLTRNTDKTIAYKHPDKEKAIRGEKLGQDYTKGAILNELSKSADRQHSEAERRIERAREQLQAVRAESLDAGTSKDYSGAECRDTDLAIEKLNATIGESKAAVSRDDSAKRERIAQEQSRQRQRERAKSSTVHERSYHSQDFER